MLVCSSCVEVCSANVDIHNVSGRPSTNMNSDKHSRLGIIKTASKMQDNLVK